MLALGSTLNESNKKALQITRYGLGHCRLPCAHGAYFVTNSIAIRQGRRRGRTVVPMSSRIQHDQLFKFRRHLENNSQMWSAGSLGVYKTCICRFQMQRSLLFHHGNCSKRHLQHYQHCHRQVCQFSTGRCCTVHSRYSLGFIRVRRRQWEGDICSARPFCIILISCLKWVLTYDSATSTYTIRSKLDANAYASVASHIQVRCTWRFTSLT